VPHEDHLLATLQRRRRSAAQSSDQCIDGLVEPTGGNDLVDQAHLRRPRCGDQIAGQAQFIDVTGADLTAQKHQHLHGKHADLYLGQPEAGMVGAHNEVAKRSKPHPARDAGAIDTPDDRHAAHPHGAREAAEIGRGLFGSCLEGFRTLGEVRAGAERLFPDAGDDDGAKGCISPRLLNGLRDSFENGCIQSVPSLFPVDPEPERITLALKADIRALTGNIHLVGAPSRLSLQHARAPRLYALQGAEPSGASTPPRRSRLRESVTRSASLHRMDQWPQPSVWRQLS
jgi:hypothetical protein